uniref:Uncharacterized protein n=1 Tax=Amphiprion percula TaxID=161767 RepID=A0A3P8SKG1_AMPPE
NAACTSINFCVTASFHVDPTLQMSHDLAGSCSGFALKSLMVRGRKDDRDTESESVWVHAINSALLSFPLLGVDDVQECLQGRLDHCPHLLDSSGNSTRRSQNKAHSAHTLPTVNCFNLLKHKQFLDVFTPDTFFLIFHCNIKSCIFIETIKP